MFTCTPALRAAYPAACFGILLMEGFHPGESAAFARTRDAELARLRADNVGYERALARQRPPLCYYASYFKRYKKTYHVLLQLESVVCKGRGIPEQAPPAVQGMFLGEVKHLLLTAGYDAHTLVPPLRFDVLGAGESYIGASGEPVTPFSGDVCLRDGEGVTTSVIYGQDARTRITESTTAPLFVLYGVEGVTREALLGELSDIEGYMRLFDPAVKTVRKEVLPA